MRKFNKGLFVIALPVLMSGCVNENAQMERKKQILQNEIQELEQEKENISEQIIDEKEERGVETYIVTFEVGQKHYTIDLLTHAKDEINQVSFDVAVSEDYYDSVEIGDVINDEFRVGSAVLNGSFGKWNITILDKRVE